jgi:hypothetical protein
MTAGAANTGGDGRPGSPGSPGGTGGRRRQPPETAKDILGQLDTALERIGRARNVAEAAGFSQTAGELAAAERGVEATLDRVEAALRTDLAAALAGQGEGRGATGEGREA